MFELIHIFILTSYIYENNPGKILQLAFLTYVKNMVKSIHIFKILWTDIFFTWQLNQHENSNLQIYIHLGCSTLDAFKIWISASTSNPMHNFGHW